jgi:hypothetical protein
MRWSLKHGIPPILPLECPYLQVAERHISRLVVALSGQIPAASTGCAKIITGNKLTVHIKIEIAIIHNYRKHIRLIQSSFNCRAKTIL